ncbi:hypothetical protein HMPREF0083_03543 [Aneurinibacillus aneurinilyticus ATCC 12856]|uniref:Uncharacterized protein n=1 Tax=Aneurinibacillus aneurinilyticus ATCC 12856 TaxID=649747 RepID=U1YBV9_ANEAE|nr:hypothetical protein HMPREF0083_03543 [Aneurinibacillus aneurinilyticus ATCC 12856]
MFCFFHGCSPFLTQESLPLILGGFWPCLLFGLIICWVWMQLRPHQFFVILLIYNSYNKTTSINEKRVEYYVSRVLIISF